jgi:riboflavin synthase
MFTGIVTAIGKVMSVERKGDWRVIIAAPWACDEINLGASICCSGVCLTVIDRSSDNFTVDVSEETLARTTLHAWQRGTSVNLERSLKMGDEMGGHIVSGHVDGVAVIEKITAISDSHCLDISAPPLLSGFVAEKGSVALDGVSLTINSVNANMFGVNIIEHTWRNTNLGDCVQGSCLNLEIDMLARYVSRLMQVAEERK